MIQLKIYAHNSNGDTLTYDCLKLYFQSFFYGERRDEIDLLEIRKITEGNILLKNPVDFDSLKDYFFSKQDAQIYIESVWHWCQIKFIKPNYLTKKVLLNLTFIDDYSEMLDGSRSSSWSTSQIPLVQKKFKISDFSSSIDSSFVDGSQYRYDVQAPGSEMWGTEFESYTVLKDVYIADTLLFDKGGTSVSGEDLIIDMLIPEIENLGVYYKPTFIKWQDHFGSHNYFEKVIIEYEREFRYFEETEEVPDGWNSISGTITKNGFTYNKYVRELYGDQTYLEGKSVYFIRDESTTSADYVTAEFTGINTELQKSKYFYKLNNLLEQLTFKNIYFDTFNSDISNSYYIASLKSYNCNCVIKDQFSLDYFIEFLRNKFEIYFEFKDNTVNFRSLSFTEKLFDLDNYKNYNFFLNEEIILNEVPNIFNFQSESNFLDFRNKDVSFYGYNTAQTLISEGIITDIENTDEDDSNFILIKTKEEFQDQIYEQLSLIGNQNGTEALFRSADGKFISWDDDDLGLATYLEFNAYSNNIYLDVNDEINLSFGYYIRSGSVRVSIGDYYANLGTTGTKNIYTTGSSVERLKIEVSNKIGGNVGGFLYNIKIKVRTKTPEAATGIVSGISKKNAALSLANTIKTFKPLMSYPDGYMEDSGVINCNTLYSKEINTIVPLNDDMFVLDFNKYVGLGSEKYIIFERKRQILTETEISKEDHLILKSNEIY